MLLLELVYTTLSKLRVCVRTLQVRPRERGLECSGWAEECVTQVCEGFFFVCERGGERQKPNAKTGFKFGSLKKPKRNYLYLIKYNHLVHHTLNKLRLGEGNKSILQ